MAHLLKKRVAKFKNMEKKPGLTEETVQSLKRVGAILLCIQNRLASEGKARVVNGKIEFTEKKS